MRASVRIRCVTLRGLRDAFPIATDYGRFHAAQREAVSSRRQLIWPAAISYTRVVSDAHFPAGVAGATLIGQRELRR